MQMLGLFALLCSTVAATPILFDGRVPLNFTAADLNASKDPYLTVVKGSQNASHYTKLLGPMLATPLWNPFKEQAFDVSIDNSSVFVPGGNPANAQYGFRRTDLLAQKNGNQTALQFELANGTNVYHFSIKEDPTKKLNFNHEYQVVFIEPSDGTQVFRIQLGSPFTIPSGKLPAKGAYDIKVRDHALNVLFQTPFVGGAWHNFAIQVDWSKNTLAVLYSLGSLPLKAVTKVVPNNSVAPGSRGEFHVGMIKLPLANPSDSAANQADVVHHGIQEGTTEGLIYSGVFVESAKEGISVGYGKTIKQIAA